MKFSLSRSTFLEALQKAQNVVMARSTIPILSNAWIQAKDDQIHIMTTDLDMSVQCRIKAEVQQPGVTTLPIRRLLNITRELSEPTLNITVSEEDHVEMEAGSSFFRIIGQSAEEFPQVPEATDSFAFSLDQGVFREMLRKTAYAASTDETRQVLNGVLLSFREGKLTVVATDGRRLALVEQEVEFPPETETELILPTKAVSELLHILGDQGVLKIQTNAKQIFFDLGDVRMSSKRIDGVYPNYRQVIPSGCQERAVIDRELLLAALRRVILVNTEKSTAAKLSFGEHRLVIESNTPDVGEARENLAIKYSGPEILIVFNPEFLMDALRNLDSDEVFLEMNDGHSPALLKCNIPFLYVLMPLRLGS